MLTQEYLQSILDYNKDTGIFTWLKFRASNKVKPGDIAGTVNKRKYRYISINNKDYKAHRLAWLYVYGTWPKNNIDHINGDPSDNRIENLRDVTQVVNAKNMIMHRNGKLLGTSFHKPTNKWRSFIMLNKKFKHLGLYNTQQEAHEAYLREASKYV